MAVFDCFNAIDKNARPKITGMENILGGCQTREMATTISTVTVVKEFFSLIMGEAMTQYGIDAPTLQDIPYEEIESILVSNVSTIFVA